MSEQRYIKWLSGIVLFLVSLVTVISFVLSYEALWNFALDGGKPWYLSWLWPIIIDLPIVVFSVVALFAVVLGFSPWPFRGLVLLATVGTVWFNYSYAVSKELSWEVYVTAPVMYFVSFEVLVWLIKVTSSRAVLITKLSSLLKQKAEIEQEMRIFREEAVKDIEAELAERRGEMESQLSQMANKLELSRAELATIEGNLESTKRAIETYQQDIEAKREELNRLDQGAIKAYLPANSTIEQRQEMVNQMANDGLTNEQIAASLGVSVGTIKNDKRAIKEVNGNGRH